MPKIEIENCKKVSVIVPNYNYANFIIERIDSIIMQTYPIYELIILDDCSTDNSCEVIEEKIMDIKKEDKNLKIKFIKNKTMDSLMEYEPNIVKAQFIVSNSRIYTLEFDQNIEFRELKTMIQVAAHLKKNNFRLFCDSDEKTLRFLCKNS